MRRFLLTCLLAVTALAAAWIAPRPQGLLGWSAPPQPPAVPAPAVEAPALPMKVHTVTAPELLIPELDAPRVPVTPRPVVESSPLPEEFWDDCLGCGMG